MMTDDGVKYSLKYNGEVVAEMGIMRIPKRVKCLLWVGNGNKREDICWVGSYEARILTSTLETFMKHSCSYIDMTEEGEGV